MKIADTDVQVDAWVGLDQVCPAVRKGFARLRPRLPTAFRRVEKAEIAFGRNWASDRAAISRAAKRGKAG